MQNVLILQDGTTKEQIKKIETAMNRLICAALAATGMLCWSSGTAKAVLIDSFQAGTFSDITDDFSRSDSGPTTEIIGGERDTAVVVTQVASNFFGVSTLTSVSSGVLSYVELGGTPPGNGRLQLVYDGDGTGLGGESLIANGENILSIDVQSVSVTNTIRVTLTDTSSQQAFADFTGLTLGLNSVFLSDFTSNNPSINLASIDIITVDVNSSGAGTAQESISFGFIESQVVPEPTSIALLGMGAFGLMGYGWRRKKKVVVE